MTSRVAHQYKILAHLIREIITDRFKRLAKDEVLSKFISGHVDPALLVDHYFQSEREALDLAEMSLLKLVSAELLHTEVAKAAEKIQNNLKRIYSTQVSGEFSSQALFEARVKWVKSRIEFYARWMSVESKAYSPSDLAREAFRSAKNFQAKVAVVLAADKALSDEITKATPSMYRLLMHKQLQHEIERAVEIWREFSEEAFKESKALPET